MIAAVEGPRTLDTAAVVGTSRCKQGAGDLVV
jgi:hypothetical protein